MALTRRSGYVTDPFTDLLFNALLGITFLFLVALMMVNPVAKKGIIDPKAEFIISATWPEHLPDDIDLWVEDPQGQVVSYLQRDAGWMHLDRDDRGELNDTVEIDGVEVIYPINQEIVTLRGTIEGEYVINLYFYKAESGNEIPVTVKVEKVNPEFKLVYVNQIVMERQDSEITAVRFNIDSDRNVRQVNHKQRILSPYSLTPPPS